MTKEEAIKRIKDWNLDNDKMEVLSVIIPELKESEDEKIRKEILEYFSQFENGELRGVDISSWIAWLKKQGEQTTDKIIERARTEKQRVLLTETNGNAHVDWNCRSLQDVKLLLKHGLEYIDAQLEKQGEKNPADEVKPKPVEWSEEDEIMLKNIFDSLNNYAEKSHPCLKNVVKDEINWLKSLKDRVQPQPKQELTEIEQELKKIEENDYIDLGLPSGTLWKSANEDGYYTYDDAVENFSNQLPTKEQWDELKDVCKWEWKDNGYDVIGPNGNTIFLAADGYRYGTEMCDVWASGNYWSCTSDDEDYAWDMYFYSGGVGLGSTYHSPGFSVRLVK